MDEGCSFSLKEEIPQARRTAYHEFRNSRKWPEDYSLTEHAVWENLEKGEWTCPHEPVAGDRCLFHLPPSEYGEYGVDEGDVADEFLAALERDGRRSKQFIGSTFRNLDLRYQVLDGTNNYPLDLHFVTVQETLDLSDAVVSSPIRAPCSRIEGELVLDDTIFQRDVSFFMAEFPGTVSVIDGRFEEARFRGAAFQTPDTRPPADVRFQWIQFDGYTDFRDATFDTVVFHDTDVGEIHFSGVTVRDARMDEFLVTEAMEFRDAEFGDVDFSDGHFERIVFEDVRGFSDAATVSFEDSVVSSGTIDLADESITYDFCGATVGRISLENTHSRKFGDGIQFWETTFDGFDFSRYHSLLEPDWEIHPPGRMRSPSTDSMRESSHGDDVANSRTALDSLIVTYLRAKNGANLVSDNVSASAFFIKEMEHKRRRHRRKVNESEGRERIRHAVQYLKNSFLGLISRYGESSARAAISGIVVIFVWQGLSDLVPQLGGITGLLEAFFVALVVFTLTRSIYR